MGLTSWKTFTIDSKNSELIVKLLNVAKKSTSLNLSLERRKIAGSEIHLQVLTNRDMAAYNFIGKPEVVTPFEWKLKLSGKKIVIGLEAYSVVVARIPLKK